MAITTSGIGCGHRMFQLSNGRLKTWHLANLSVWYAARQINREIHMEVNTGPAMPNVFCGLHKVLKKWISLKAFSQYI